MLSRVPAFIVALLIFLVVLTSWYAASLTRISLFTGGGLINMGMISNLHVIQTTDQGKIQYQGTMQTASEFNNGNIDFTTANLIFLSDDGTPWTLTSDTGTVLNHNQQINLVGNVNLSRPASQNSPPVLAQTDAATFYTQTQKVTGSDLITFTQPGTINKMQGVGFIADLQAKTLKLLAQVRGIYAPNQNQ